MSRSKKKRSLFSTSIPTNVGTLIILLTAVPVVLLSNTLIQDSQKIITTKAVKAASDVNPHGGTAIDPQNRDETFHCPKGAMCKPFPSITCTPRHPDASSAAQGKLECPPNPSISPLPSLPPGCFYRRICEVMAKTPCIDHDCNTCRLILICVSPKPSGPVPSCQPTPTCNPKLGILCRPQRPCFPNTSPKPTFTQEGNIGARTAVSNAISNFFQNFFRGLFGK